MAISSQISAWHLLLKAQVVLCTCVLPHFGEECIHVSSGADSARDTEAATQGVTSCRAVSGENVQLVLLRAFWNAKMDRDHTTVSLLETSCVFAVQLCQKLHIWGHEQLNTALVVTPEHDHPSRCLCRRKVETVPEESICVNNGLRKKCLIGERCFPQLPF